MNAILIPIIAVAAIGLVCAVMLVVASKLMSVPTDEKYSVIRDCLPGANCGACGYAGCDGYAKALSEGNEKRTNLCIPGADAAASRIAAALGVEAQDVVEMVAVVACCGDSSCTSRKHEYSGIPSCAAANLLFAGDGACSYGCLGYGDCAAACPNDAICIEDGLARVIPSRCIGCGLCAKACPKQLIRLVPDTVNTVVKCSNSDKGAMTRKACSKGCIACKKCERDCPADAISIMNNRAVIDYEKCVHCGYCAEICTTGCISWADLRGKNRFRK